MADKVTPTRFDATARLCSIVKEALGPMPRVCQETVLLDLERARMTAEDLRSAAISPYPIFQPQDPRYRLRTWREVGIERNEMTSTLSDRMGRSEGLIEEARAGALRAADSNGTRNYYRVALISISNLLVDASRAMRDEESDEESDHSDEVSDEEMSSEADVGSYCEACARVKRSVAWYHLPFTLPNGFRAYSACAECRSQHGLP